MASPRRLRTLVLGVLAVGLVASGCAGSNPAIEATALDALSPAQRDVVEVAEAWIDEEAELVLDEGDELRFARLDDGPGVDHVTFAHVVRDHLVLRSEYTVHVLDDGTVQGATDALTHARPTGADEPELEPAEAEEIGVKAVEAEGEAVGRPDLVWHEAGALRLAWRVQVDVADPPGVWEVLVAALAGEVISVEELTRTHHQAREACDLPAGPAACVFVPDPILAADGPVSVDEANRYLEGVTLEGLDDPSSGALRGEYVDLADPSSPHPAPVEPDGTWAAGRGAPGFEHAMAYYWIDRTQRLIQRLGFTDVRNGPIVVHARVDDLADNAFYTSTHDRLEFGVSTFNGTSIAEDAQVVIHEYGHAILDEQAPGLLAGAGDADAYHEAFGDLFAYFVTLPHREGANPGDDTCLAPWGFGDCIRRVDSDAGTPDDKVYEEHLDAAVYSGAVYDVFTALLANEGLTVGDCFDSTACDPVRERLIATLLSSHGYLTDYASFDDLARNLLLANDALYGGADAELIAEAFAGHGIRPTGTPEDAAAVNLFVVHDDRRDLAVYAGVQDPSGTDLCEPIQLWDHEGPPVGKLRGRFDISGTECAALGPPSAGRHWYVQVIDDQPGRGTGALLSASVSMGTTQYRVPAEEYIPDGNVAGTTVLIDGSGEPVGPPVDPPDPVDPETDPFLSFAITHPWVGDLLVEAGVARADGLVTCSVRAAEPHQEAGSGGLSGDVNLALCADDYPPSRNRIWFFLVADVGALDEGTVTELTFTGPDGEVRRIRPADLPAPIPDADPRGILFTWER